MDFSHNVFDRLPDEIVIPIFNQLHDAKSLCSSMSICKRFRVLVPKVGEITFTIPRTNALHQESGQETQPNSDSDDGDSELQFLYVPNDILKPLSAIGSLAGVSIRLTPPDCLQFWHSFYESNIDLNPFPEIRSLHLRLRSLKNCASDFTTFLKWKAELGRDIQYIVFLAAESVLEKPRNQDKIFHDDEDDDDDDGGGGGGGGSSVGDAGDGGSGDGDAGDCGGGGDDGDGDAGDGGGNDDDGDAGDGGVGDGDGDAGDGGGGDEDDDGLLGMSEDELKLRCMWSFSCGVAACRRHHLIREALCHQNTIENAVVSDESEQGMVSMNQEQIQELKESIIKMRNEGERSVDLSKIPLFKMKIWYLRNLELPDSGKVMEGATLVVIRHPAHRDEAAMGRRRDGDLVAVAFGGGMVGEAARKLVEGRGYMGIKCTADYPNSIRFESYTSAWTGNVATV